MIYCPANNKTTDGCQRPHLIPDVHSGPMLGIFLKYHLRFTAQVKLIEMGTCPLIRRASNWAVNTLFHAKPELSAIFPQLLVERLGERWLLAGCWEILRLLHFANIPVTSVSLYFVFPLYI